MIARAGGVYFLSMIGCALAMSSLAIAQTYPSKPIRIVIPVVPGSAPDLRVRQIAPKLSEALGQPVIVENRPGGNGQIGAREAAKAPPDGHTLFNANINNALNDVLNPDLLGGTIVSGYGVHATLGPHIASGKLRALAVAGVRRLQILPDTPTLAEAGLPGIEALTWNGLFAPAGTPMAIVRALHAEIVRALNHPDVRDPILASGSEPGEMAPEQFAMFRRGEVEKWGKVVKETGIKLQ